MKNQFAGVRGYSGYTFFVLMSLVLFALSVGSVLLLGLVWAPARSLPYARALLILCAIIGVSLSALTLGHLRTAFRAKYRIPDVFPQGSESWSLVWDYCVGALCPCCSIAQMARHVFQYGWVDAFALFIF
jgi:hypothetical protein